MRERKLKRKPEVKPKRRTRERLMVLLTIGILLLSVFLILFSSNSTRAEDFSFGSENIVKGTTQNPTFKNTEDGSYESLIEGDQYPDSNFSASTESVTYGTAGGGAFPSVEHYYPHQGYYTVNLTIVDANGLTTSTSKVVRIYLNANDRFAIHSHSFEIYLGWGYLMSLNVLYFFAIGAGLLGISFAPIRPTRKLALRIVGVVFMLITLFLLFD